MKRDELVKISNRMTTEDLASLLLMRQHDLIAWVQFDDGRTCALNSVVGVCLNGPSVQLEVETIQMVTATIDGQKVFGRLKKGGEA